MAFNYPNYYGYAGQQFQQQYPQPIQQQAFTQATQAPTQGYTSQDERIWVQGEGAAQAYLVAPNSFVRLWDSLENVYYEKFADQSGRPTMIAYEYKKRQVGERPEPAKCEYVKLDDFEAFKKQIEEKLNASSSE